MNEIANSEGASETEKPVHTVVKFPPFPDPTDDDFDEDISEEERTFYKNKFPDLNTIKTTRLHCTSCDRHMGCAARNDRMRSHPMLRTLVCHSCHTFYNSGEFEKGDDGSELYCRWCGQGGQVYCCSDCPHVFCAKCIKRNLGTPKIKEIENADDWKCFKCKPDCLMDLRAICWAVLRYCDLKNKMTYATQDPELKAALQKDCALDHSECCKHKTNRRNQKINDIKKKEKEIKKEHEFKKEVDVKSTANIISKMPSTIQVKKFALLNIEDIGKTEKKAQKRSASPKPKPYLVKNPISIVPGTKLITASPIVVPPLAKKIRLPHSPAVNAPFKYPSPKERTNTPSYSRIRPKPTQTFPIPIANSCFNGFSANAYQCSNPINDNINLSLESLTQGLDMAAVAAMANSREQNDDVVCTPDFPMEPLCEVTEDNDDDVQCITPGPVAAPKLSQPPPLVPRTTNLANVSDIIGENIIQMTDNDVTVNESTGGLKFRVDPQTLSSNKMYRLPDGRIFAINANPTMPGGYSATIVAVTEANKGVNTPKGATFAAKLSSVATSTPALNNILTTKSTRSQVTRPIHPKSSISRIHKTSETSTRECDLNVPIEWYRYNLIDAVDALEYSLSRLNKLKKEATSVYLRSRSINEMRSLHRTLERLLNTSSTRFEEIRENLNKGLKQYIQKKSGGNSSDEDDDVEILPNMDDDPIFIDENSVESNLNGSEHQEVDLTGPGSSEYNDSGENKNDKADVDHGNGNEESMFKIHEFTEKDRNKKNNDNGDKLNGIKSTLKENETMNLTSDDLKCNELVDGNIDESEESLLIEDERVPKIKDEDAVLKANCNNKADNQAIKDKMDNCDKKLEDLCRKDLSDDNIQEINDKVEAKIVDHNDKSQGADNETQKLVDTNQDEDDKMQDSEISEDTIETLLKDENSRDIASANSEALQVT